MNVEFHTGGVRMGYQIIYEVDQFRKIPTATERKRSGATVVWWALTILCILAFVLHNNLHQLRQWILPGDPDVTQAAITAFAEDIRTGESIEDAFTDFCLVILENA